MFWSEDWIEHGRVQERVLPFFDRSYKLSRNALADLRGSVRGYGNRYASSYECLPFSMMIFIVPVSPFS